MNLAYRDRSHFEGLKARLLAIVTLLVLAYLPLNLIKVFLIKAPVIGPRIAFNIIVAFACVLCLRSLLAGKLAQAGNALALTLALAVHLTVLIGGFATTAVEPLSSGIQIFAFDLVILLVAVVFASRRVATVVFAIMVLGLVGFYLFLLRGPDLGPGVRYAADTLLRDGIPVTALVFVLAMAMVQIIEAANKRSDEALRRSDLLNKDLVRLEHEARILSERRRELLEIKREFISMVSHEFRTPLTTIQGAQFLLEKLLSESASLSRSVAENAERWLNLQASGLKTLNKLVDQVLILNRIEHMTGEAALELLSPAVVMVETVAQFNDSMGSPRVELRNDVPAGFMATMDSGLVKAAAENLISNGLKYSPLDKTVSVRVYTEAGGWAIEVMDQGRGIPAEDQPKLFQAFFRASNVGTVPGTGLGLAIVRRAVDFHSGRVEFESGEDAGTRFILHFPSVVHPPSEGAPLEPLAGTA
ncbi:MAG TPA: HAMP domain-containing sensor histidine kinase [Opitutaceae bacterium]|jgi:signal transduction histidine kinase